MEHIFMKNLMKFNSEQQKAIETIEGPLLIIAGAGSGKTATLTGRIAYMIGEKNIAPRNILAVTFTNKAAKEMKERVAKITGLDFSRFYTGNANTPYIGTFHSFGVFLLKKYTRYPEVSEKI